MAKPLIILTLLGLAAAIALIGIFGAGSVWSAFEAVGWGAVLVMGVRAVETSGAGVAWAWLLPTGDRPRLGVFMLLRWLRESINCLLPVAQVGGDLIGARLLTFWRVPGGPAAASVIADLFVQTVTQFVFTLLGVGLLIAAVGDSALARWVLVGCALMAPALVGFFLAQRFGGFRLVERLLAKLARNPKWAALGGITSLHDSLQAIYRRPGPLMVATLLHLVIWFVGVWEIDFALRFMGHGVDYTTALIIESLAQAVRGAAFVVPGAIGVQEGGFIALCAIFGIPAPTAIALSLVKRLPEVLLGIPGLFIWQGLEGRRLLRRGSADAKQDASQPV
ncbi:lysylphosphatidylglycerol synthase domain-containing protein [Lichenihabitans sp. Uapishka_5]|uniref:lysylphosphatidylglycerol synthase domain-containing protein n=1 Tax=Lichenihabitans sp. Uapishka_5 TaxID=3037302 RepID=UPI0029E80B1C|nr:lysylphosphatidylglycerol synthase domain-containing protein [Lichenihabitans sp. Uapishka_5]MDX7950094.1 lysylphosphatidylglycerol synthase domain-containing protein [Lichenihabitans sp. Uapishka_5]